MSKLDVESKLDVTRKGDGRWWRKGDGCEVSLRPGQTCPQCHLGRLDYDELFRLLCRQCGYSPESGAFT